MEKKTPKEMILEAAKCSRDDKWEKRIRNIEGISCSLCSLLQGCKWCPMDCHSSGSNYQIWADAADDHGKGSIPAIKAAIAVHDQLDSICKRLEKEIEEEKNICKHEGCFAYRDGTKHHCFFNDTLKDITACGWNKDKA